MTTPPLASPIVTTPAEGPTVRAFGAEVTFHVTSEQSAGQYNLATIITPPGGGPPAHCHTREDECFVVQEGRMSFLVNGEWREVETGAMVYLPKNIPHTFRNIGDTPSRMLFSSIPGGFDHFFIRCEKEFHPGPPDMARIVAISAEFGISYL